MEIIPGLFKAVIVKFKIYRIYPSPPAPHGTLSYLRIGIWMPKPPLLHSYLAQLGSSSPLSWRWAIFTFDSYKHCKVTEKFAGLYD